MGHIDRVCSLIDPALFLTVGTVEMLRQLATGKRCHEISQSLGIATDSVYEHVQDTRRRLGAHSNPELVRLAIHHGFIKASE